MSGFPFLIAIFTHIILVFVAIMILMKSFAYSHFKMHSSRLVSGWWLGAIVFVLYVFTKPEQFLSWPDIRKNYLIEDYYIPIFEGHVDIHWISVAIGFASALLFMELVIRFWPKNDRLQAAAMSLISSSSALVLSFLVFSNDLTAYMVFAFLGFIGGFLFDFAFFRKSNVSNTIEEKSG